MKNKQAYSVIKPLFLSASLLGASAAHAETPSLYSFPSQFSAQDSVNYTGQTFRQVLINDLTKFVKTLEAGGYNGAESDLVAALNSYFAYQYDLEIDAPGAINGFSSIGFSAKAVDGSSVGLTEGTTYEEIFEGNKDILGKIAGKLLGWGASLEGIDLLSVDADGKADTFVEPEDLVQAMFAVLANRAVESDPFIADDGLDGQRVSNAYVLPNGVDYSQMLQKFLHGALSYSQATRDYLSTDLGASKGLNAQNDMPSKPGVAYTALEHHWDEAFGYFGAARDFLAYTDNEIAKGLSIDTDANGSISLNSEVNFPLAKSAAKRDLGANGQTDFTTSIMTYFLEGRRLIAEKPEGYRALAVEQAQLAIADWEKSIGATVIHYINSYLSSTETYGTSDYSFTLLAKFWSEMKGYGLNFQFNPNSILSTESFIRVHELMGDQPVLPQDAEALRVYREQLLEARDILRDAYGFDAEIAANW